MSIEDIRYLLQWWGMFFLIGIIFLPFTARIFDKFPDKGYIFSKILGLIFISYSIFILGLVRVLPFTQPSLFLIIGFFAIISFLYLRLFPWIKLFIIEEIMFFVALFFWSFIRAHQPDIHGLEKFMDYGFVNAILKSSYFPPIDMWFSPFPINYYYFGHLFTAVAVKLSFVPSEISYNLMLATLFAFTFTCAFSIGANLISAISKPLTAFIGGLLTAFLMSMAGNLHTIYTFFLPYQNENPVPITQLLFSPLSFPNQYWYPNATRFIQNTIHEFPIYSFVVADLHGHVLSIPLVLTIIALLLHEFLFNAHKTFSAKKIILVSFFLGVAYMTNAWDGIIYFLLTTLTILSIKLKNARGGKYFILNTVYSILIVAVGFLLFSLPFSLFFKPFVSGIGVLCAPEFLTKLGKLGPLLFEQNHCQRSPLWQMLILHGFFYFWAVSFIVFLFHLNLIKNFKLKIKNLPSTDVFVLILILLSTLLLIIPEFIYMKDIYPAHYRANTMFKLGYQAFIMLSIASGYIIIRIITNIKYPISNIQSIIGNLKFEIGNYWKFFIFIVGSIGLFLVMVYPYFAITSYYGELKTYYGLNGTRYLKTLYPSDYEAINWLNKNIKNQPIILEAQGDSYTDYGRVSANTGLSTVLGWTVHEWLWRGNYDIPAPRIPDVQNLYESEDIELTKKLIKKYTISLVFIGDLERQKYTKLQEEKFNDLGKIIFQKGQTKIYQVTSSQ